MIRSVLIFTKALAMVLVASISCQVLAESEPLAWDAIVKEQTVKPGELKADFIFNLTNVSPAEVVINSVRTSCGCTVAKLPTLPWKLSPGTNGQVFVTADLRGKFGTFTKYITVDTSYGPKLLNIKVNIPTGQTNAGGMDSRVRNIQMAMTDRQVVFRGDCASCHAQPTIGKTGETLYELACGICHESPHRASMVTDLRNPKQPRNREYWTHWITIGKPGSLMPAFSQAQGGPLTQEQIDSLVNYLTHYYPPRTIVSAATPFADD